MDDRFETARRRLGDVAQRTIVHPWHQLHDEVDRLIHDYAPRVRVTAPWQGSASGKHPVPVDVIAQEGGLMVVADMPGMKADDVEVSLSGGALAIRGGRKETKVKETDEALRLERDHGGFYRAVEIPFALDESRIKATLKDGVLTVRLPRSADGGTREHTIAIRAD